MVISTTAQQFSLRSYGSLDANPLVFMYLFRR